MAAPVDAGSIYSDVRIRLDKLNGDIKSVQTSLDKITKASKKTATASQKGLGKFFSFIKTSGVGSFLALGAVIAGTVKFLKDSEAAASDAQEEYSKFDAVFESIQEKANATADEIASSFGIAKSTSRELLSATGDILVGFGFTEEAALDLAKQTTELSADLASFTNFEGGAARASAALTKALVGESESVKALGIVIRQDTKEYKERIKSIMKTNNVNQIQAKALAALQIATEQSGKAMGDVARTWDSAANVEKRLTEQTKALKEVVGAGLIPTVTAIRKKLGEWAKAITKVLVESNKLRDADKAIAEGNATLDQRTLRLEKNKKLLAASLITMLATNEAAEKSHGRVKEIDQAKIAAAQNQLARIDEEIEMINRLQNTESRRLQAIKDGDTALALIETRKEVVYKAQLEAITELTKREFDALTPYEQKLELIQEEIDRLAILRNDADALGVDRQATQNLINDLYRERAVLQEESIDDIEKERTEIVKTGEDYLSILIKEKDGIISVDEARKEAAEKHFQRARDNLRNDLESNKITTEAYLEGIALIDEAEEENAENLKQTLADKEANVKQYVDMALSLFSSLTSALSDLYQAEADKHIAEINRVLEADLDAIDKTLEAEETAADIKIEALRELSTEEQALKDFQRAEQIAKLEASLDEEDKLKLAALYAEEDRILLLQTAKEDARAAEIAGEEEKNALIKIAKQKTAKIEYEANLASWEMKKWGLIASGAQAAISTFVSAGGWPLGLIPAGVMAGITLLQLNTLNAQKPVAPSFATGGIVLPTSGGSLINVAEKGAPEFIMGGGAEGRPMMQEFANMLNDMKGGGGNQVFYLTLPNGKVLAEAVAPSFNNGIVPLRLK